MSTLYTFGCSFTEDFDPFVEYPNTTRYEYIMKYHNGIVPKSWTQIMSNQLNVELKNYGGIHGFFSKTGAEGNCNFSIFNNICQASKDFKKNDIVIIEWTYMERFKWADFETFRLTSILPNQIPDEYDKNTLESILINRTNKLWIEELFKYQILLDRLADGIGLHIYYWTVDKNIVRYKIDDIKNDKKWLLSNMLEIENTYQDIIEKNGGLRIMDETNGLIMDDHLGSSGHEVLANLFLNYIL
jgi:hypothetical protein